MTLSSNYNPYVTTYIRCFLARMVQHMHLNIQYSITFVSRND